MALDETTRMFAVALIGALILAGPNHAQEEPPAEDEPSQAQEEPPAEGETGRWAEARETYKKAKRKAMEMGETLPDKMPDWIKEDLENAGSWEYRVVETPRGELETTLNELGTERWECFSVESHGKKAQLVLKRRKRSRLREIDSLSAEDLLIVMKLLKDRVWEEPDG